MTNEEAKVYIQYIKVLLAIDGHNDNTLNEALDVADNALGDKTLYDDPRFP